MKKAIRISLYLLFVLASTQLLFASELSIPAPIGDSTQTFCDAESLTLADAAIFNTSGYTDIYWYANADQSGSAIDLNTVVVSGDVYFAFQAVDPDATGKEVSFELISSIPAPTGDVIQSYCEMEGMVLADTAVFNTSGFDGIYWFSDSDQTNPLPMNTPIENAVTYYAFQGIGACASALEISITLEPQIPAPDGDPDPFFCYEQTWTLNDIPLTNNNGYTGIYWYAEYGCGPIGPPINPTTIINDGDVYYAVQGINACCPLALEVNIHIPDPQPAPTGDPDQYFNEGENLALADVAVFNTGSFDCIYWFTDMEQLNLVDSSTYVNDGDVYYAFQAICSCECQLALGLEVTFHMIPMGVDKYRDMLQVYPNPVNHVFTVFNKDIETIHIYNMQGQSVNFKVVKKTAKGLQLDLSQNQPGVYFVRIKTDQSNVSYKIIKR
jgi:hypothetical protein